MKYRALRADAILLFAAVLWGAAFVAQRAAMRHLGPMTYNGIRFALGALALGTFVAVRSRRSAGAESGVSDPSGRSRNRHTLGGAVAGVVLFVAASLQQAGLVHTTAGKAGFITGLYVPLVPILGLVVGRRTGGATWVGAALAVVGLYFLSVTGPMRLNPGDGLVMACAVVWAVHVLLIGRLAPRHDPLRLGVTQFTVVAVASLVAAAFTEPITAAAVWAAGIPILYGGLISVAIAYTLQIVGQRDAPPGHAALLLSLETVFAALTGYCLLGETFGPRESFGAAVMLGGMLVSQIGRLLSGGERSPGM